MTITLTREEAQQVLDALEDLIWAVREVSPLAKQVSNVAYNLGQAHQQREGILETVGELDYKLSCTKDVLSKWEKDKAIEALRARLALHDMNKAAEQNGEKL